MHTKEQECSEHTELEGISKLGVLDQTRDSDEDKEAGVKTTPLV